MTSAGVSVPVIPSISHACPSFLAIASWVAMRFLATILPGLRSTLCVGACLLLTLGPSWAAEPTLARLSFWLAPERMDEFATDYQEKLLPILKGHGLVESAQPSRATMDSVFSRLFEFETPGDVIEAQEALAGDEAWQAVLQELGAASRRAGPDRFARHWLAVYDAVFGPGKTVPAGPGKTIPVGPGRGHWERFDVTDGLGYGPVRAILQDRQGYLWVGTNGGVSRFDGSEFTTFTRDDGLPANRVTDIVEDRDGNLWFGTHSGVCRYDPQTKFGETWTTFKTDNDDLNRISSLVVDRDGNIWMGTFGGVRRYDGSTFRLFTTEDGLGSNDVRSVMEDRDGNLWFGLQEGVSRYNGRSWTTFSSRDGLEGKDFWGLLEDGDGSIWLAPNRNGVYRYDGKTFQLFPTGDESVWNPVTSIVEDRKGVLWFGTWNEGVIRFDPSAQPDQAWTSFGPDNRVLSIYLDREENLWIGTLGGGISRHSTRDWTTYTEAEGLPNADLWRLYVDSAGHLWVSAHSNSVVRYDSQSDSEQPSWTEFSTADGLPRGVYSVFQDRDEDLWFGTNAGVSRYDSGHATFTSFTTEDGLVGSRAFDIYQDRKGDYWFNHDRGVNRFDGQRIEVFTREDGLPPQRWWWPRFSEDREGNLWISTYRYEKGTLSRFERLPTDAWESIQDRQGNLWFAQAAGLTRYDGEKVTVFDQTDGLGGLGVRAVIQDRKGHFWIATQGGGVSRYDGQVFQTVTQGDGLGSNHVRDVVEDRRGDIWFATNSGLTRYRQPDPSPPPIYIDAVVTDRRYEGVSHLALPSDLPVVAVEFRGLSFKTRPGAMVYRYRLNPYHDWRTTREQRVEYQDLPRGDYTFEIEAVDRDLVYSESPAVVALTVHIPYERMGLWSGLVIAIVLVGWQTARVVRRDRRLREGNQALSDANKELFQVNVDLQREQVLERLRGQAQGMQSSEDIKPVAQAVYQELTGLGLPLLTTAIAIHISETEMEGWAIGEDGRVKDPFIRSSGPKLDTDYHDHLEGSEATERIRNLTEGGNPRWRDVPEDQWPRQFEWYNVAFQGGHISMACEATVLDEFLGLIKRFGEVFGYAHSRWEELKVKEAQNRRLAVEASVQRLRAEVQSMDEASDFERILSLLTDGLKTVELSFDGCEIDVLDEPVENPTMAHFVTNGFRYTTFRLDPNGNVAPQSYNIPAPFQPVNEQTIERFIAGEPWQGLSDDLRIVEVPAGSYGRLRLTASDREPFTDDEVSTLREFADAVALGYARYLDIREIQEATVRKSAFLASMSHELRTPMNAIKGFTNLLLRREKSLSDRGQENLQKVSHASDHLLTMINDLLDLSKIGAGRMDVNPEQFNVKELVVTCCDTVSPLIQEGVELRQDVADDIGEANTDKARVQQMVINLLSNAIKFTDSGSVTVSASQSDGHLVLSVADTGKGIPADEVPTIFDEYRQAEGSESAVQKGTGLGLSITKKFAELLGGTIGVESEVGEGSTFTVRVPVEYSNA